MRDLWMLSKYFERRSTQPSLALGEIPSVPEHPCAEMCELSELCEPSFMIDVAQQRIRLGFAFSERLSCGGRSGKVAK